MQVNHEEKTIAIMYVGPKAVKRDTVTGYKPTLRFVRGESTDVPCSVANALLDFSCFQRSSKDAMAQIEQQEKAKQLEAEEAARIAEEEAQREKDLMDTIVDVDGEEVDLGKYNQAQLEAFVMAHDLEITKGSEKVKEFGLRVRDAYREKTGE